MSQHVVSVEPYLCFIIGFMYTLEGVSSVANLITAYAESQ